MPVRVPEDLIDVPEFHRQSALVITNFGEVALSNIVARVYDPSTGEFGEHLDKISLEIGEVLDDVNDRARASTITVKSVVDGLAEGDVGEIFAKALKAPSLYSARSIIEEGAGDAILSLRAGLDVRVLGEALGAPSEYSGSDYIRKYASPQGRKMLAMAFERRVYLAGLSAPSLYSGAETMQKYGQHPEIIRQGLDARVLREAVRAPSLYSASEGIEKYATSKDVRRAMRVVLDARVETEAQHAPSLHSARETVTKYGSSNPVRREIFERLNPRVEAEALRAVSAYSALKTIDDYAFGDERTQMRRKVATQWLPREQNSLAIAEAELQSMIEKVEELEAKTGIAKFVTRRKLKRARSGHDFATMIRDSRKLSVERLEDILQP